MALKPLVFDDALGVLKTSLASLINAPDVLATMTTPQSGDTLDMGTAGTTETAFASTAKIPAQYLKTNMVIEIEGFGSFASAATGSQRAQVYCKTAAAALSSANRVADSGALNALLSGQNNTLYHFKTTIVVVSVTGNNVVIAPFSQLDFVSNTNGQTTPFMAGPAPGLYSTITIDKSVDNYLVLTDTFGGTGTNNNTLRFWVCRAYNATTAGNSIGGSLVEQGTAAILAAKYSTLAPTAGLIVQETDTNLKKIGDGVTTWATLPYGPGGSIVDFYSGSGNFTWTKRPGAKKVKVEMQGAGGGGGSGRRGAAGTIRTGGAGGAGGPKSEWEFPANELQSTEAIALGTPGTGGAAVTTDDTNGNSGGNASSSYFGSGGTATATGTNYYLQCYTSTSGGGSGSTVAATIGSNSGGTFSGGNGGASQVTGTGNGGSFGNSGAAGGGGGGASIVAANTSAAGGTGGAGSTLAQRLSSSGVAGTTAGTAGSVAGQSTDPGINGLHIGGGGGGGGGTDGTIAGAGGNGGFYGGGGGGGAGSLNGNASGKGGNGATGYARITTYF